MGTERLGRTRSTTILILRAAFYNMDYYGWIKFLAPSLAGNILEDDHGIYSVHGACLDLRDQDVCILSGSGAGKTTHTYGLLRSPKVRVVSDDLFFARIFWEEILAYGSEKNFYIRADLADIWEEFSGLVEKAVFCEKERRCGPALGDRQGTHPAAHNS